MYYFFKFFKTPSIVVPIVIPWEIGRLCLSKQQIGFCLL